MKTQCPDCRAVYTIRPEYLGKKSACKNCGASFVIEPLLQPAPAAADGVKGSAVSASIEPEAAENENPEASVVSQAARLEYPNTPDSLEEFPLKESPEEALEEIEPAPAGGPGWKVVLWVRAVLKDGGRPAWPLALAAAALGGALAGGGAMGLIKDGTIGRLTETEAAARRELQAQTRRLNDLNVLKKEQERLRGEIERLEEADYPAGSIPQVLSAAAVIEYKAAEALLAQRAAGGGRLKLALPALTPDPELAAAVETEMAKLKSEIEARRSAAAVLPPGPRAVAQTALATEEINLALLNRRRLIAKFGLSSSAGSLAGR